MAISITWGTKVIYVPQSFLAPLGGNQYELNLNDFRLALKDLEDSEDGMVFPDTHQHNTEVTLAGVTLARTVEIINGYTVTFEDGQYVVRVVGANSNLLDVINSNQVSVVAINSAGLIVVSSGSGLSNEQDTWLNELYKLAGLLSGTPLTVSATQRQAGAITQSIEEAAGVVTVTRQ